MNAKLSQDKKTLIIEIPFSESGRTSNSGKTTVHSSTNGNKPTAVTVNGHSLIIGLNAYTSKR